MKPQKTFLELSLFTKKERKKTLCLFCMIFKSIKGCLWFLKRDFLSISWRPHSIPSNVSKTKSMKNNPYLFTNSVSVWHIFRPSKIIIYSLNDKPF